jgi:hypothetical protein
MNRRIRKLGVVILVVLMGQVCFGADESPASPFGYAEASKTGKSPLDELPGYIKQVTYFGERADWSLDGKKILFLSKTFGDVFEVEVATGSPRGEAGKIRLMTGHFYHEGFTRAMYLANGDILLSGARKFDASNPQASRSGKNAELWVMKKDLSAAPTPLGEHCSEGPAVSRKKMTIAWTLQDEGLIYMGDIVYENEKPKLVNKKLILDANNLAFGVKCDVETQNFRPQEEKELIFSAYMAKYRYGDVAGLNLETGKIVNYSNSPKVYDEPEGIFPDGKYTLIECDEHNRMGTQYIDIYKLALDPVESKGFPGLSPGNLKEISQGGSGQTQRLTHFSDYPGYKASNPVVSDDGKFIAFQYAKKGDQAGVGRGILVLDLEGFVAANPN